MEIKAVRGMHDLFGDELHRWQCVETRLKEILHDFGYQEIRTPVVERLEVFSQTVGDATDIVEKQMYLLQGEEKLVLRPEGTSSFIRAVIEHQLHQTGQPQRFYYFLPMFRHERPQKGRQRQFFQFGGELILDPSPEADAEIIALLDKLIRSVGVTQFQIHINSVGCSVCRPQFRDVLKKYFTPHLQNLCPECQGRFERSPLRILDCKKESCRVLVANAPKISAHLCQECISHHEKFKKRLAQIPLSFVEDPSIVRGLDYYCRTAFEFSSTELGAQSAICGGGRYDGLSTKFGEKPFPAVGFGLGFERLLMLIPPDSSVLKKVEPADSFLVALGEKAFDFLYPLSLSLRSKGVKAQMAYDVANKSLKSLLKQADRSGAAHAVILGENEMAANQVLLKNMKDSNQESLSLSSLEENLIRRVTRAS